MKNLILATVLIIAHASAASAACFHLKYADSRAQPAHAPTSVCLVEDQSLAHFFSGRELVYELRVTHSNVRRQTVRKPTIFADHQHPAFITSSLSARKFYRGADDHVTLHIGVQSDGKILSESGLIYFQHQFEVTQAREI